MDTYMIIPLQEDMLDLEAEIAMDLATITYVDTQYFTEMPILDMDTDNSMSPRTVQNDINKFKANGIMVNPNTYTLTTIYDANFEEVEHTNVLLSSTAYSEENNNSAVASHLSFPPMAMDIVDEEEENIYQKYIENKTNIKTISLKIKSKISRRNNKSSNSRKKKENVKKLTKAVSERREPPFPKPTFSYTCMIIMAIKSSLTGRVPVSEIYKFICENFPYYDHAPEVWKNSVRHILSLNNSFEKIGQPLVNGKRQRGYLWAINPEKMEKMDRHVLKLVNKNPQGIKNAMYYPEKLEAFEKGDMKYTYAAAGSDLTAECEDTDMEVMDA